MLAYILYDNHGKRKELQINGSKQVKINKILATLRKDIQLTIFAYFIRLFGRLVLRKGYRENGSEIHFGSYLICICKQRIPRTSPCNKLQQEDRQISRRNIFFQKKASSF